MPGPIVQATFATGASSAVSNPSDVVDVPYGVTSMKLTTLGLDGSNTIKTQKSVNNGSTWTDQVTYNSEQTNTGIVVAHTEQWRVVGVTQQALKDVRFKLSCES